MENLTKSRRAILLVSGILSCAAVVGPAVLEGLPAAAGFATATPDDPAELVAAIEGESIAIEGPLKVEVVRNEIRTMLRSGSDVRVKSGAARMDLIEGGVIAICGPAHFSVLKSHGSLTLALDSGIMHARIDRIPALTVYTPHIQARPIAIGEAPQDVLVGVDAGGAMCLRATSGAVRLEQQLTGQTLIVPQGGNVALLNGQIDSLRSGGRHCSCEPPAPKPAPPEMSTVASAEDMRKAAPPSKPAAPAEKPPAKEEPIYQVFMPPLAFDASAKVQPEPDPRLIVLVRRVRVRPTLIYHGRVEGEAVAATAAPAAQTLPLAAAGGSKKASPPANEGVFDRVRSFFRRLWSRS